MRHLSLPCQPTSHSLWTPGDETKETICAGTAGLSVKRVDPRQPVRANEHRGMIRGQPFLLHDETSFVKTSGSVVAGRRCMRQRSSQARYGDADRVCRADRKARKVVPVSYHDYRKRITLREGGETSPHRSAGGMVGNMWRSCADSLPRSVPYPGIPIESRLSERGEVSHDWPRFGNVATKGGHNDHHALPSSS